MANYLQPNRQMEVQYFLWKFWLIDGEEFTVGEM